MNIWSRVAKERVERQIQRKRRRLNVKTVRCIQSFKRISQWTTWWNGFLPWMPVWVLRCLQCSLPGSYVHWWRGRSALAWKCATVFGIQLLMFIFCSVWQILCFMKWVRTYGIWSNMATLTDWDRTSALANKTIEKKREKKSHLYSPYWSTIQEAAFLNSLMVLLFHHCFRFPSLSNWRPTKYTYDQNVTTTH